MSDQEWTGEINPDDEKYDKGGDTRYCKAGRKVLVPLGYERWKSSKGTPMVSIMYLCVVDLVEGGKDVGAVVWRNFALSQNAVQFFARFARAMKHHSPFNVFKDDDVQEIVGKGACIGKVEVESGDRRDGNGKWERSEVKFFDPFDGDWEPDWDALVAEGEEKCWDTYLKFRAENPRGAPRKGKGGGGGSEGGGGGGGGGGYTPQGPDDDIPF